MSLRLDCALDGIRLEQLDHRIRVTDLTEHPAEIMLETAKPAVGDGMLVTGCRRTGLRVDVCFAVRERDVQRRAQVLDRIADWARGTVLTMNTRPGRMLRVRCTGLPCLPSALDWTAVMTVSFTAHEEPWWQDTVPVSLTLDSVEEPDGFLYVPGTVDRTPVSVRITCLASEGMTAATIICGDSAIRLEGMTVGMDGEIVIDRDKGGKLRVTGENGSLLACRTDDSDDEPVLPCGVRTPVHLMTDARARAVFTARGRYL